jgi:hypothetical protein
MHQLGHAIKLSDGITNIRLVVWVSEQVRHARVSERGTLDLNVAVGDMFDL